MRKISILVSKECFGNCTGCYLDPRSGEELSLPELTRFAALLKEVGYEGVTLSGGDPLARKDIIEIVDMLFSFGFDIHLDTTGNPLLNSDIMHKFVESGMNKKISLIGIPLDGSSDKIIQEFRTGWVNMDVHTKKLLKILCKAGFKVSINTVAHKRNKNDLANIYKIISDYSCVERWEIHQFVSISQKSLKVSEELSLTKKEFVEMTESLMGAKNIKVDFKLAQKKRNFRYLDFMGDIIEARNGVKKKLCNIREADIDQIKQCLME